MIKVLVHTVTARLLHWLTMASMMLLIVSGLYIHAPDEGWIFRTMDGARLVHFIFMYIILFSVGFRVFYAIKMGEAGEIAFHPRDVKGFPKMVQYYLFMSSKLPLYGKYNPGQKAMYTAWLLLIILQGATGFALYWPGQLTSVETIMGGLGYVRLVHYLITWVFLCTVVAHVYLAAVSGMDVLKSMITGYLPQDHLEG